MLSELKAWLKKWHQNGEDPAKMVAFLSTDVMQNHDVPFWVGNQEHAK